MLQPLAVAFDLKEDFFDIWDNNPASKDNAMKAFDQWKQSIPKDGLFDCFRDLAKTDCSQLPRTDIQLLGLSDRNHERLHRMREPLNP